MPDASHARNAKARASQMEHQGRLNAGDKKKIDPTIAYLSDSCRCFSLHILRLRVISQRHEPAVPQVVHIRPFDKLKLPHQHRLEPPAFRHLRRRQASAPAPGFLLRQIRERAFLDFQRFDLLEQLRTRRRRESVPRARGIYKVGPS